MEGHGSKPVRSVGAVIGVCAKSAEDAVAAHLVGVEPGDLPSTGRSYCIFETYETADGNLFEVLKYIHIHTYILTSMVYSMVLNIAYK